MTDEMMARIHAGLEQRLAGDRPGARATFEVLWSEIGDRGDPLHRCALAHHMADVQDSPEDSLRWDLLALEAAGELTDERARRHHESLSVAGFYPSLHLNLGESYRLLGDLGSARAHAERARTALSHLADDDYAAGVKTGVDALFERLGSAGPPSG